MAEPTYRGRLAPSPTGFLHLGHARTFWTAQERARTAGGILVFRNEDLDRSRCRSQFVEAMYEDLRWFGLEWQEGPDTGGPRGPYEQSQRRPFYETAFEKLRGAGLVYPCACSRRDVARAAAAPNAGEDEALYPGTCRPSAARPTLHQAVRTGKREQMNWRFQVPDGETIHFVDGHFGRQSFVAGRDFGDFVVWRHDGIPSYQLAVTVDDAAMGITEVVRGEDLLKSAARQILIYRAIGFAPPQFLHCPLVCDERGERLAKRHDALSLRELRQRGWTPEQLRAEVLRCNFKPKLVLL